MRTPGRTLSPPLAPMLACAVLVWSLAYAAPGHAAAPNAKKVIRLQAVKVEGKMQKPQAFYILQRSSLNFEALELKESFIPKILRSVEDAPFK